MNRDSIKDKEKRRIMENLVTDLREVIESRNLVSLYFNVPDDDDLKRILDYLTDRGFDPTISPLAKGGAAVHIIIDRSEVKFLKPIMREMGAKRIATSPVITFGD